MTVTSITAANPWRGEVPVTLAGVEYTGRPSYSAILQWETATGRTSTELMVRLSGGLFALAELTAIVHAALNAGGHKLPLDEVGRLVVEEGQVTMLPVAGRLLHNALTGGKEPDVGEQGAPAPGVPRTGA